MGRSLIGREPTGSKNLTGSDPQIFNGNMKPLALIEEALVVGYR